MWFGWTPLPDLRPAVLDRRGGTSSLLPLPARPWAWLHAPVEAPVRLSAEAHRKPWILTDLPPLALDEPAPVVGMPAAAAGAISAGPAGVERRQTPSGPGWEAADRRRRPAVAAEPPSDWAHVSDGVVLDYGPAFLSLEMLLQLSQDLLPIWRESLQAEFPPAEDPGALRALRQQTHELLVETLGERPARAIIDRMNRLVDGPRARWEELAVLALVLQQPSQEDAEAA